MKQTAVEYLHEEIKGMIPNDTIIRGKYKHLVKQAKEMEEKEIKDAWLSAYKDSMLNPLSDEHYHDLAEEYYNNKYNK